MRELTDVEKRLINKNLVFIKEELEYKEDVELKKIQLTLDTAELVVKKQIKDKEKEKKVLLDEINLYKNSIEELERQLKEGVQIKK